MLLQALWMLPLTGSALRLAGFRRCQSILIRLASPLAVKVCGSMPSDLARAYAAARMVEIAAHRGCYRARCLQKSLVLWWVMRRRGMAGDVWFGVRKEENGLDAHAWVEFEGVVLNDKDDIHEHFAAFKSPISSAGMRMRHV